MKKHAIINTILLFLLLAGISLTLIFIANKYILTVDFYDRNGEPVSGIPEMETLVYENIRKVIYIYSVLYLAVKIFFISLILYTGLYFFDISVPFRSLLRIVILAEFVFVIPAAEKIWWFWQYRGNLSLEQWQQYYLLSLTSMTDSVKPVFLYPLQTLNLFEISYWLLLASGIETVTGMPFARSFKMVCYSYLPALFVWIVAVAFFTIIYFPQSY